MTLDPYGQHGQTARDAPRNAALGSAVESDAVDLVVTARGISFATAGAIKVDLAGGGTIVIPSGALAAGVIHPLQFNRLWATGTDATGVVVYW